MNIEINIIKDIIIPLCLAIVGGGVGGGLAIWATKMSINASIKQSIEEREIERKQAYNNVIKALRIELTENIHSVKLPQDKELLLQFLSLSNYVWNNAKSYIEKIDENTIEKLLHAYTYVSRINNIIQDTNATNQNSLIDNIRRLKKEALPKLEEAKQALDNINIISCKK